MTKIMVVEDDPALREIYSVRLAAEGYEVATAGDGEEALAVVAKERPDLVLSDVMMPKISGFDMLDILRTTPETQSIRVVMLTALSSEDQRARGESLGADKYLVKSQVGVEDIVASVHAVMGDRDANGAGVMGAGAATGMGVAAGTGVTTGAGVAAGTGVTAGAGVANPESNANVGAGAGTGTTVVGGEGNPNGTSAAE